MKIVLDANVIVAALAARGLCESVFELCLVSHDLLQSEPLLEEISRNLAKKVKLDHLSIASFERMLRDNGVLLTPSEVAANACSDPNDLHVLGLAKAGQADFIVTGDSDLLSLKRFGRCRVVTPRQFWTFLHQE